MNSKVKKIVMVNITYRGGEHKMDDDVLLQEKSNYVPERGDIREINDKTAIVRGIEIEGKDSVVVWIDLFQG